MIDEPDNVVVWWALLMWRNVIETGEPYVSAVDANNMGRQNMLKPLDPEQRRFVARLEDLAESFRRNTR